MTTTTIRPPLLGIRHVALFVPDLEIAERFWVDVMGYAVEWRPDGDNVYLCSGSDNLALHRAATPDVAVAGDGDRSAAIGGVQRLDHIGLAVPAAADVDAWAVRLAAHGIVLKSPARTHRDGSRSLYFHAPDGVLVQIIHHLPLAG